MADFRRYFVLGGSYFFTLVTEARRPIFASVLARKTLGQVLRECRDEWPFEMVALVLLPEHLHAIWSLPSGDARYSARWSRIKKEFSKRWIERGGREISVSQAKNGSIDVAFGNLAFGSI